MPTALRQARFREPAGIAVDTAGIIYVADQGNNCIRQIRSDGVVETLAGTVESGFADGQGAGASFSSPNGLVLDHAGNPIVADFGNDAIRRVSPRGVVTTILGEPGAGDAADHDQHPRREPSAVAIDPAGRILFFDRCGYCIRRIERDGSISLVAGNGDPEVDEEEASDGPALEARFEWVWGLTCDAAGNIYAAEFMPDSIRRVAPDGMVTTLAGGEGSPFYGPQGVAVDREGNVCVVDLGTYQIYA
ncbi:MAG: hypothetical protein ACRDU0_18125, partial [Mycobacterium sp.]